MNERSKDSSYNTSISCTWNLLITRCGDSEVGHNLLITSCTYLTNPQIVVTAFRDFPYECDHYTYHVHCLLVMIHDRTRGGQLPKTLCKETASKSIMTAFCELMSRKCRGAGPLYMYQCSIKLFHSP